MTAIAIIYPYYENPLMLSLQLAAWKGYAPQILSRIRIIIVDDGSPNSEAAKILKNSGLPLSVFRINENIPWNQHGARNLGAMVAERWAEWIFMSDMDMVLPPRMADRLVQMDLDERTYYSFERINHRPGKTIGSAPNTVLLQRKIFWQIGGYDEDYCGTYGGDRPFLNNLAAIAKHTHCSEIALTSYDLDDVADANTRDWNRRTTYRLKYIEVRDRKTAEGNLVPRNPLRFTWYQAI